MSPSRAECAAAAVARSDAFDAAIAEVAAVDPLPAPFTPPLDCAADVERYAAHTRAVHAWFTRHRNDLRATARRHHDGQPNPSPTLPFGADA